MKLAFGAILALALSACGNGDQVPDDRRALAEPTGESRFDEWEARNPVAASPVTDDAEWVLTNGILTFGNADMKPFFSIDCDADAGTLNYIRHERAPSEAKALAAFIGNRERARWPVDATASDNAVWKGQVTLTDPKIGVLTGGGSIELTIPGAGTLKLKGGPELPEFVRACEAVAPDPPLPPPRQSNAPIPPPSR